MVNFRENTAPGEMMSLCVLLFFLPLLFPLEVNSYVPVENYAVNCGDSNDVTIYNRIWVGDVSTKQYFSIIEPQTGQPSVKAEALNRFPGNPVFPVGSARLSLSKFTYSFVNVTSGPKFLRLHFYPMSYLNFEPYNALFSVIAGNFTLLKDFNASLWVHSDEKTISKEYCLNVETGERLNITFLPSNNHSDAYAFINGIEVVSMPPFLYYTNLSDLDYKFKQVGHGDTSFQIQKDKALDTLYRVNVGDNQVPPSNDTGMFRNWDNDYPGYLEKQYPLSVSTGYALQLNYRNNAVPNYTAPADVYLTARSYGMDATENYNVTWTFEVDSQFTYMVRLHFCEFEYWRIKHYGDRAFQIFIAETLAEVYADLIGWGDGFNLVPIHRDYAVVMSTLGDSKKVNLSIKLQQMPDIITKYHDVILNGIEIFKISDQNNNLAGPNPEPILSLSHSAQNPKTTTVIVVVVAVSALMVASVIGIMVFQRRRRTRGHNKEENWWKKKTEEDSSFPSCSGRYFTIGEIRAATNNFADVSIIGVGGFGNVYKGYIDGATPVAIKRLKPDSHQGASEFMNEIELLSQLRHLHLVSLIGYCNDGVEMILVYDFMQRGTLREYLYNSDNQPLSWKKRLEILLGAARGLHYLHTGAQHNIIHRDVKSTNILLDENWVAKLSDLGLSKVGPTGISKTHVTTLVKGSLGYLDPEYFRSQRLTLKSDVYSFGVVLLEVLCGRPPIVRTLDMQRESLVDWVRRCYDKGEIDQTVDPFIKDSVTAECLKCYSQMFMSCLHDDGNQRLSMSEVVGALEFALQLVENEEDNKIHVTQEEGNTEEKPWLPQFTSDHHEGSTHTGTGSFSVVDRIR